MKIRHITLLAAALLGVLSAYSSNLLDNGSFEEFTPSTFMSLHSAAFDSWSFSNAWGQNVDSADVIDGKYAFTSTTELKQAAVLYQSVDCSEFAVADSFKIRVCYKNLNDSTLRLCSYWAASAGSEPIADEPELNQVLPYSSEWDTVEIVTAKPEGARNFEFRVEVKKKSLVLLDNFSFEHLIPTGPYFTIIPAKDNYSVTANIHTDTLVAKIVIRQYNLTQPVQLNWSVGTDKKVYSVSKSEVTAEEDTVEVRFHAGAVGKYNGFLNITDDESPEASVMNKTISFYGTAIDTTKTPVVTITPMEFDTFRCKAYETVTDTFVVQSENCYDYVHVMVDDETGDPWAFGLSESFFLKNATDTVVISFSPKKEGLYTAKFIAFTSGIADTIRFSTVGVAENGQPTPPVVDWDTTFVWNTTHPYAILNEDFDHADTCRNKTLKTTDWQNVVRKGQRPWWGFYSDSTTQAKFTSYFSYQDSASVEVESWLVTPALDYNNAPSQYFTFDVMSDLIYKGQTGKLEIYYIDPSDSTDIYFEHIESLDTLIPANNSDLAYTWSTVVVPLVNQPYIPDAFHMAFRFTDMGGNNGVTYYISNVTWGVFSPSGVENINANDNANRRSDVHKFVNNGQLWIVKDGKRYNLLGMLQ